MKLTTFASIFLTLELALCEKLPNTELFLVRIFPKTKTIRRIVTWQAQIIRKSKYVNLVKGIVFGLAFFVNLKNSMRVLC